MKTLGQRMITAAALLAPYAVPHQGTLGRMVKEADDDTRFPFQRDRDRIVHTHAFRRLQGKTQVFVAGEGDHYRTRLTHTVEVAQIARDMARTLGVNEDLAECIALAHDLGHPPFGHAGEEEIDLWIRQYGSHFEHNEQTLRILTILEEHSPLVQGLNVNLEVLEGVMKHRESGIGNRTSGSGFFPPEFRFPIPDSRALSLEAQIVNIADEIAYSGHDCDDGLRAGLFSIADVSGTSLGKEAIGRSAHRRTSLRGGIIHLLVRDVLAQSERLIEENDIGNLDDVYASAEPLIAFSTSMKGSVGELRDFLHTRVYDAPAVRELTDEGRSIVRRLCEHYMEHPQEKILSLQKRIGSTLEEAVKDYVAGMTDSYAKERANDIE